MKNFKVLIELFKVSLRKKFEELLIVSIFRNFFLCLKPILGPSSLSNGSSAKPKTFHRPVKFDNLDNLR